MLVMKNFIKIVDLNIEYLLNDTKYYLSRVLENSLLKDYVEVKMGEEIFHLPIFSDTDLKLSVKEKTLLLIETFEKELDITLTEIKERIQNNA